MATMVLNLSWILIMAPRSNAPYFGHSDPDPSSVVSKTNKQIMPFKEFDPWWFQSQKPDDFTWSWHWTIANNRNSLPVQVILIWIGFFWKANWPDFAFESNSSRQFHNSNIIVGIGVLFVIFIMDFNIFYLFKGHLISECLFDVFNFPKNEHKNLMNSRPTI